MKSIFQDEKKVANLQPSFKTPDQVKKENSEFPTKYEIFLNSEMEKLNVEFSDLIGKPKTQQNKIRLLKIQIFSFYLIEKMPKRNNSKVKKISEIIKDIELNNNLEELKNIERNLFKMK